MVANFFLQIKPPFAACTLYGLHRAYTGCTGQSTSYICFYFENFIFEFVSLFSSKSDIYIFEEEKKKFFRGSPLWILSTQKTKNRPKGGFIWRRKNVGYQLNKKWSYMLWENLGRWAKFNYNFVYLSPPSHHVTNCLHLIYFWNFSYIIHWYS